MTRGMLGPWVSSQASRISSLFRPRGTNADPAGIVPTADQMQTDMVWNPLAEQIEHGWDESLPKPLPNPDDLYRPTLIGAWAKDRLIGGAFVMPDSQDAQALVSLGADKAAQASNEAAA